MYNEYIFSLHLLFLMGCTYGAFLVDRSLLQAIICLQFVCANLFIVRQMPLLGLVACGGGMYIASSSLGLLLLQDFYGKKIAHRTLYLGFAVASFFLVLSQFHLWYAPALTDSAHQHFDALLGRVPHITVASLIAHFVSHYLTLVLYRSFKRVADLFFPSQRTVFQIGLITMMLGQMIDSVIFFGGVFWGQVPFEQIVQMIKVSMAIKLIMVMAGSLLLTVAHMMRGDARE